MPTTDLRTKVLILVALKQIKTEVDLMIAQGEELREASIQPEAEEKHIF